MEPGTALDATDQEHGEASQASEDRLVYADESGRTWVSGFAPDGLPDGSLHLSQD